MWVIGWLRKRGHNACCLCERVLFLFIFMEELSSGQIALCLPDALHNPRPSELLEGFLGGPEALPGPSCADASWLRLCRASSLSNALSQICSENQHSRK